MKDERLSLIDRASSGRALLVQALDDEAKGFYERFGFRPFSDLGALRGRDHRPSFLRVPTRFAQNGHDLTQRPAEPRELADDQAVAAAEGARQLRVVCGRGVESTTGAVAVGGGGSCSRRLSPMPVPHSSPWLRFQSPLIEPDMRLSRIRLSDEIMPSPTGGSLCAAQGA